MAMPFRLRRSTRLGSRLTGAEYSSDRRPDRRGDQALRPSGPTVASIGRMSDQESAGHPQVCYDERMTRTDDRRTRWADRENDRRGRAFAAELDAWRLHDAALRALRATAARFTGRLDDGTLPMALRRDERIYLVLEGVQSVEAPGSHGLPPVVVEDVPVTPAAGPVPAGVRVGATGTAVVTSRRLVFVGPQRNREWSYQSLTGLIHDPALPLTLLEVSNRKTASGLLVHVSMAATFRFQLQLALADAVGMREALVRKLDVLIAESARHRPPPPALAEPGQAPAGALWSPLGVVLAAAAVLFLLVCGIGALLPDAAVKNAPGVAAPVSVEAPAATRPPPALAVEPVSPSAVAAGTSPKPARSTSPAPTKSTAPPKPKPKPTPKPKPKPVKLCGAPQNSAGFTFCGGSLIRTPDFTACEYFDCIPAFPDGKGYMMQCDDGMLSMSGGRPGSCSRHGGNRRPVYRR
ncbi:hypothetical protein ACWEOZ_24645 [Actinoplanes sp. NPDC004185]